MLIQNVDAGPALIQNMLQCSHISSSNTSQLYNTIIEVLHSNTFNRIQIHRAIL